MAAPLPSLGEVMAPVGGVQANGCKQPSCTQFGLDTAAPGEDYRMERQTPQRGRPRLHLRCRTCRIATPVKSNPAIAEEMARQGAPVARGEKTSRERGCPDPHCRQHGLARREHPEGYALEGSTARGSRRLRCKACDGKFTEAPAMPGRGREPWLHVEYEALKMVMGHAPVRKVLRHTGLSAGRFYALLARVDGLLRGLQGELDRRAAQVMAGSEPLRLSVDRQTYMVNWSDRKDRRKVFLQGVATAEAASGYVLGMDVNYDPEVDAETLVRQAKAQGEVNLPACQRHGAGRRVWLPGERDGVQVGTDVGATTGTCAEVRYTEALQREDIETGVSGSATPQRGALVREDVSLYAHFLRLRRLLGSPSGRVDLYFEQESGMRAACLTAWRDAIVAGNCNAYYVRIAKDMTAEEKQALGAATKERISTRMEIEGLDYDAARYAFMRDTLRAMAWAERGQQAGVKGLRYVRGPFGDMWVSHPLPSAFEPHLEVSRLTRHKTEPDEAEQPDVVEGYADASLGAVDRFFMQVRYALNALDRGRTRGNRARLKSRAEQVWDVYHPYNPAMVQRQLDLFRFHENWCKPGKDGNTPAMRLGLVGQPCTLLAALDACGEDMQEVRTIEEAKARQETQRRQRHQRRAPPQHQADPAPSMDLC